MSSTPSQRLGLIGLGVMGENLALNFESHGLAVTGFDLDADKRARFDQRTQGRQARSAATLAELVASLSAPRCILLMVPAGSAVDAVLAELRPLLAAGDVVIDGGNTLFTDTARRIADLQGSGVLYVGMGVSGGEEGALRGPALMPGGDAAAWPRVAPLLQAIAARADDGQPCCEWMGPGGAGHFVKMVHNGIEYADMQMIGEAYWLMQELLGMHPSDISAVFRRWNAGALGSYLVGITADILATTDPLTGDALVLRILDTAAQKGTGKWTSQIALDLGAAAPTIADAVFARTVSALQPERVRAAQQLHGPQPDAAARSGRVPAGREPADEQVLAQVHDALLAAKVCAYAQGFALMRAADQQHGWGLDFARIAKVWRAGCIIRARLLEDMRQAFEAAPDIANLLLAPHFTELLARSQQPLREVVARAAQHGVPVPGFMSALAYYDAYRSARLPANLLQAQRDYFGAHTYQRTDRPGSFHTHWTHSEA